MAKPESAFDIQTWVAEGNPVRRPQESCNWERSWRAWIRKAFSTWRNLLHNINILWFWLAKHSWSSKTFSVAGYLSALSLHSDLSKHKIKRILFQMPAGMRRGCVLHTYFSAGGCSKWLSLCFLEVTQTSPAPCCQVLVTLMLCQNGTRECTSRASQYLLLKNFSLYTSSQKHTAGQ